MNTTLNNLLPSLSTTFYFFFQSFTIIRLVAVGLTSSVDHPLDKIPGDLLEYAEKLRRFLTFVAPSE